MSAAEAASVILIASVFIATLRAAVGACLPDEGSCWPEECYDGVAAGRLKLLLSIVTFR